MIHELLSIVLTGETGSDASRPSASVARSGSTGGRAGRTTTLSSSPGATATGATTEPAMMRSPGLERGAVGGEERPHEGHRRGRVLDEAPLRHDRARLGHRRDHGPGVDAGDLVAEDDAALADVAGQDRLDVVEGDVEVHQLERRRQPGDARRRRPTRMATSTSTAGAVQPARDDRGPVGRHPGVDQVADDRRRSARSAAWMAGVLKPIFQPTGVAPAASSASRRASRAAHAAGDGGGGVVVGHGASLAAGVADGVGRGVVGRTAACRRDRSGGAAARRVTAASPQAHDSCLGRA